MFSSTTLPPPPTANGDYVLQIRQGQAAWVNTNNVAHEPAPEPVKPGRHWILIIAGQSNAQGQNDSYVNLKYDSVDPRIKQWSRGNANHLYDAGCGNEWIIAQYPLQHPGIAYNQAHIGFQLSFCKEHLRHYPDDHIYLVCCSTGGSSFAPFNLGWGEMAWRHDYQGGGKNLFEEMIQTTTKARAALPVETEMMGILWHQGESESATGATQYATELTDFITQARARLYAPNLPFIVGTMLSTYVNPSPPMQAIDSVHRNIANLIWLSEVADISTVETGVMTDFVHFNADTLRAAGPIYYEAWLRVWDKYTKALDVWFKNNPPK